MVKNAMLLGAGQVVTTVLTLLLSATLARALSPADFGLLYLLGTFAGFAFVFVDWGYAPLIIRETARHPETSGLLIGSALWLRAATSVLASAATVLITLLLGYELRTSLLSGTLILAWMPQFLGLSFGWAFRGFERMDCDAALGVVLKLATLLISVACIRLGGGLAQLILSWTLAGFLTLATAAFIHRKLRLPAISSSYACARGLLRGGAPFMLMSLAVAVSPLITANVLFKMSSPTVVAWYGIAANVMGTLIAPASILGMTMYPRLSKVADDPAEFRRTFGISFRLLLVLAVLGGVGTYLFAEVPVEIIYSLEKFGPAVDTLRALAAAVTLMYIDVFLGGAILAAGKSARLAVAKVASIVVTAVAALVLVPLFQARFGNGGLGVAYATMAGEVLMVCASAALLRHVVDRHAVGDFFRSLVAGAMTLLLFRLLPAMPEFLGLPLCVAAFGGFSLLVGAVRPDDLKLFRR